jgi:hypothetical protein
MAQAKMSRKQDKKVKETMLMLEDERRHADQYKEQAEKVREDISDVHYDSPLTIINHTFDNVLLQFLSVLHTDIIPNPLKKFTLLSSKNEVVSMPESISAPSSGDKCKLFSYIH